MTGWAATNTLREVFCDALATEMPTATEARQVIEEHAAALALVETALDAAADLEGRIVSGPDWNLGEVFNAGGRLAAALRAVREGAS